MGPKVKTLVYSLYGGPGTGKSTTAAGLFYQLKQAGVTCELVREYVKDWAWDNRTIQDFDQLYFLGKQIRRESMLYGKVPLIITDSPVFMSSFYAEKFSPKHLRDGVNAAVKGFYAQCRENGIVHRHICLRRSKKYDPNGRYQTEEQAREMDLELWSQVVNFTEQTGDEMRGSGTTDDDILDLRDTAIMELANWKLI